LKIRDFTFVNERFQKWRNEEIGLYRGTLNKISQPAFSRLADFVDLLVEIFFR